MNRHQITLLHRSQLVIKSPIVWEIENQTKMLQNKTSGMFWLFEMSRKWHVSLIDQNFFGKLSFWVSFIDTAPGHEQCEW